MHVLHTKVKKIYEDFGYRSKWISWTRNSKEILNSGHDVIAVDFKTNNIDDRAKKIECNLFEIENPYEFLINQIFYYI